jgi:hypothetical protein
VADNWYQGNAAADGDQYRGWLLGHFIDPAHGIRHTGDLEVKWGIHPAGQTRPGGRTTGETRTSLLMLISGRWRQEMTIGTFILENPGDYIVWGAPASNTPGKPKPTAPCSPSAGRPPEVPHVRDVRVEHPTNNSQAHRRARV